MLNVRRSFPACRCLAAAVAVAGIAACSSVDKPVSGQAAQPIPGESKPYPNLASVPERPRVTPREERERIAQGLAADRARSNYSDDVIPRQVLPGDGGPPLARSAPPAARAPQPAPAAAPTAVPTGPVPASRPEAPPASAMQSSAIPPPVLPPEPETPAPASPPTAAAASAASVPPPAASPPASAPGMAAPVQTSALPPPLLPAAPEPATAATPTRLTPAAPVPVAQASEPLVPPAPLPEPMVPPPPAAATPSPSLPPVGGTPAWPPDRRERSTLPTERPDRGLRNDRYMPPTLSPGPAPSTPPPILAPVPGRSEPPGEYRPTMLAAHGGAPGAVAAATALRAGRAMRLATIGFGSGSAQLDRGDRGAVEQVASIQRRQGGLVVVVGHASREAGDARSVQDRIANLNVSLDRANAVARALERAGVPAGSIRVEARGDSEPAIAATTAAAEAANRRVEIFIDF